jgi:hypothetical protein
VDEAFRATDCAEAKGARWIPFGVELSSAGTPKGDAIPLTSEPVHVGIISPPVGQTCSGEARNRDFGDFFTATLSQQGKLIVAISADQGSAASTHDIIIRER